MSAHSFVALLAALLLAACHDGKLEPNSSAKTRGDDAIEEPVAATDARASSERSAPVAYTPGQPVNAPPLDLAALVQGRSEGSDHPLIRGSAGAPGSVLGPARPARAAGIEPRVARSLTLVDQAGYPAAGTLDRVRLANAEPEPDSLYGRASTRYWLLEGEPVVVLDDNGHTSLSRAAYAVGRSGQTIGELEATTFDLEATLALVEALGESESAQGIIDPLRAGSRQLGLYWILQIREALARGQSGAARRAAALLVELRCTPGGSCLLEADARYELASNLWTEARQLLVDGGDRRDALIMLARAARLIDDAELAREAQALQRSIEREQYYASLEPEALAKLDTLTRLLDDLAETRGPSWDLRPAIEPELRAAFCQWRHAPYLLAEIDNATPTRLLRPNGIRYIWMPLEVGDLVLDCLDELTGHDFRSDYRLALEQRVEYPSLRAYVEAWWAQAVALQRGVLDVSEL